MKTCWKELSLFSVVGEILQEKYDSATKVRYDRRTGRILKTAKAVVGGFRRGGKRRSASNRPANGNLVYIDPSPNYCVRNNRRGTLGTVGRECKADTDGHGSCKELCCKRGFLPFQELVKERCQCKFHWCCEVRCKQCVTYKTKYICQ